MRSVGIVVKGFQYPLATTEEIEALRTRLRECQKDGKDFVTTSPNGEKQVILSHALDQIMMFIEGTIASPAASPLVVARKKLD